MLITTTDPSFSMDEPSELDFQIFACFYPQIHTARAEQPILSCCSVIYLRPQQRTVLTEPAGDAPNCQGEQRREWIGGMLWQMETGGQTQDSSGVLHWLSHILYAES